MIQFSFSIIIERPIRSFELLTDVSGSWNTDKTVNVFMAKKTPLANSLSQRAVPSSSPICHGQVQHEYKRGKWQKRYLELREHGLWLAKKDTVSSPLPPFPPLVSLLMNLISSLEFF